jgi:hypothetical protein
MKTIFIVLLGIFFIGCKKDNMNNCSSFTSYNDTVIVNNYKLWFAYSPSTYQNSGGLELIDMYNNNINGSADFSINFLQLKNGNKCWETTAIIEALSSSSNVYSARYEDAPNWATDPNTLAIIKFTVSGSQYDLIGK